MNEELVRINADLDSFAYAASHDLKEPLRTISQTVFFLNRCLAATAAKRHSAASRRSMHDRADDRSAGWPATSFASRQQRLAAGIDRSRGGCSRSAEIALAHPDGELIDLIVQPLPSAVVDFMCLRDVFQNLFSNARKYSRGPRKRIEVGTVMIDKGHGGPPRAPGDERRSTFGTTA